MGPFKESGLADCPRAGQQNVACNVGGNRPRVERNATGSPARLRTLGPVLCLAASIARLCVLFREIGYARQAFEMIVRGNKFDIVFSGAGVDDGIGKGELVR